MGFFNLSGLSTTRALQLFQVMRLGAVILTSILLAKSGLSIAGIGNYEMLLFIGTTLTFFWVNGLLQGMTPIYAGLGEKDRKSFIFNNFLVFCFISLVLFALMIWGERWVTPMLTGQAQIPYYRLFCLYLLLNLPTFPVEYYYLLDDKPRHIVGWGGVSFGLHVLALYLPVVSGFGLEGGFMALILLSGAKLLWTAGLVLRYGTGGLRFDLIRQYLVFSAPLTLNVMMGNLILLFDNWLVGWYYRDEAVFAVFRYGSREFPLATALATALGVAMIPRLSADMPAGLAELRVRTGRLMHLLFPLTILLLFVSRPLFPLVFNPGFAASAPLFNIYLLVTASRVLLPNAIVLAKGVPQVIFGVGVVELLVKVV
jgi:O-antigen/teichoic acid export membrane protein